MGRVIVCADDFAMSEGISEVIAELARARKVNAISCMAISERWPEDAALLQSLPEEIAVGLHLVLSEEVPLTAMPRLAAGGHLPRASRLERMAILGALPKDEIRGEIAAQFERFHEVFGRVPDFVDGHQHVHAIPGIRQIVLEETAARAPDAWVRTCEDRLSRLINRPFRLKGIVNALQSAGLRKAAVRAGLYCNDGFAGLYDFTSDYARLFPKFFRSPGKLHLVICHPGDGRGPDSIAAARLKEAAILRKVSVAFS